MSQCLGCVLPQYGQPAIKSSEHFPINFHITSFGSYCEWSKHIDNGIDEWRCLFETALRQVCPPSLPLSLQHVIHQNMSGLTTELAHTTQKPLHKSI